MLASLLNEETRASRARRGFTLTEIAVVLGVIGMILAAIWVAAGRVSSNQKTAKAAGQVLQIINGYQSLYGAHGIDAATCWTDTTCMGVNAGYFPSDMVQSGVACVTAAYGDDNPSTYPITPWGSKAIVSTCQANNTIDVAYYGLSQAACISLASAIYTSSPDMVYQAIAPDGHTWADQWLPPYGSGPAWTISQINSLCGATNTNGVQVGVKAR